MIITYVSCITLHAYIQTHKQRDIQTYIHTYTVHTWNDKTRENENENENENAIQYTTLCDIRHKSLCSIIGLLSWVGVSSIYYDILFKRVVVVVVVRHVHKRYNPLSQQSNVDIEEKRTCDEYHCVCVCMHLFLSFSLFTYHISSSSRTCHAYIHTNIQTNKHTHTHIHTFLYKTLVVSHMRVLERNKPCR